MIAVAYEKVAEHQETAVGLRRGLPRHPRPGRRPQRGDRRGRPRGDALAVRRRVAPADGASRSRGRARRIVAALPSPSALASARFWRRGATAGRGGARRRRRRRVAAGPRAGAAATPSSEARAAREPTRRSTRSSPRCSRRGTSALQRSRPKARGCSRRGNYRQAAELCRAWADLDLGNADAWRCLRPRAAGARPVTRRRSTRCARRSSTIPTDRTLDAAISRSQSGDRRRFPRPAPALTRSRAGTQPACRARRGPRPRGSTDQRNPQRQRERGEERSGGDQQRDRRAAAAHLHREDVRRRRRRHGRQQHRGLALRGEKPERAGRARRRSPAAPTSFTPFHHTSGRQRQRAARDT